MKKSIIKTIITILLLCGSSHATNFKVTQVIEVGSTSNLSYLGALKWSPDGTKLAFFSQGSIYISDTLGTITDSIQIDFFPQKFEWWSNNELILKHKKKISSLKRIFTLSTLNIQTGATTILEQFLDVPGSVDETFVGPYKSTEGDTYYEKIDNNVKSIEYMPSVKNNLNGLATSQENIIYKADNYKLINISNDFMDTVQIIQNLPIEKSLFTLKASYDRNYILLGNILYNIKDPTKINNLGKLAQNQFDLSDFFCEVFSNTNFNPKYNELLIELYCEISKGDKVIDTKTNVVLYDISTNSFKNLSTELNLEKCSSPAYSPDGLKIAMLSNRKAFIIRRELVQ